MQHEVNLGAKDASIFLDENEFRLIYELAFSSNAHSGMFFAACAGYKGNLVDPSRMVELHRAIMSNSPEGFERKDIKAATDYRTSELIYGLRSEIWEMTFGIMLTEEHSERFFAEVGTPTYDGPIPESKRGKNRGFREVLSNIREKVIQWDQTKPYQSYLLEFDYVEVALEVCLQRRYEDTEMIYTAIDQKFDALAPIFLRLKNSSVNKYGDYDPTPALEEVAEFISYTFTDDDFDFFYLFKPTVLALTYIESRLEGKPSESEMPNDGIDFEHWCAQKLSADGWEVNVSKASGDQGVDILAKFDSSSVAIQCKRFSKPIGNKAVQEVFAGAKNLNVDIACVIGTGGFTRSARELASTTGVFLVDAINIGNFAESLGMNRTNQSVGSMQDLPPLDNMIEFKFEGDCGSLFGNLLRSAVKSVTATDMEVFEETKESILEALDETSGHGSLFLEQGEAVVVLVLAASALKGEVFLTNSNAKSLRENSHFEVDRINANLGQRVKIENLIKTDLLEAMLSDLTAKASLLGPSHFEIASERVSEVLAKQ